MGKGKHMKQSHTIAMQNSYRSLPWDLGRGLEDNTVQLASAR